MYGNHAPDQQPPLLPPLSHAVIPGAPGMSNNHGQAYYPYPPDSVPVASASASGWPPDSAPPYHPHSHPPQAYTASPTNAWFPHNMPGAPGAAGGMSYNTPPMSTTMSGSSPYNGAPHMRFASGSSGPSLAALSGLAASADAALAYGSNGAEAGPSHTPDTDTERRADQMRGANGTGSGSGIGHGAGVGAGAKKKKRKTGDKDKEGSVGSGDESKEKRVKTGRACDACRTKKIRCDILPSTDGASEDQPICAHCKQYNLECTFFLPITETRFKKKRNTEPEGMHISTNLHGGSPGRPPGEVPARMEGPTSLSFLLHTSIPASASEAYDLKHHHSWEVSDDGNGIIRVKAPPHAGASSTTVSTSRPGDGEADDIAKSHNTLTRPTLNAQTISVLVNAYFDHLAHFFPIISRAEFAAKQNPPPLLLYSICGLGATRRQFPRELFAGLRGLINGMIRSNDILSDARLENVQALLILAQVGDLHAQPTAATASASLMRTGSAIRMAQDLGLHRESHLRAQTPQDLAYVELRRRIWAACVIMDRWYGAALGIPLQIDLLDCDVLLPAGYDVIPDQDPSTWPVENSFVALSEHLKLSILVGRVLKTIYSPTGLKDTTDDQLYTLLEDMRSWKDGLPEDLQYVGVESSSSAGLLHMAYATLLFLFWRPFMRITYTCPAHLKFALEIMHWSAMIKASSEACHWLDRNDESLDTIFIFPYTATSCALAQYHNWVRRRDPSSLEALKMVRETAMRWETAVQPGEFLIVKSYRPSPSTYGLACLIQFGQPWRMAQLLMPADQMSIRRKTCETMTLLYEAALKTNPDTEERPPAINPTAGVQPRPKLGKAVWVPDVNRPHGGIWVARDNEEMQDSGLQVNSVVMAEDVTTPRSPPELGSTHPAVRARAIGSLDSSDRHMSTSTAPHFDGAGFAGGESKAMAGQSSSDRNSVNTAGTRTDVMQPAGGGVMQSDLGSVADPALIGPAMVGTADYMQILRDMQTAGSNVNPQMNFGVDSQQQTETNRIGGFDLSMIGLGYNDTGYDQGPNYDVSILDNLPANGLNFDQWNTWFSNIDRMAAPDQPLAQVQQQQQQGDSWNSEPGNAGPGPMPGV